MKLKFGSWSLTPYFIAAALVGLQACGGGSSPAPLTDQNPDGIYTVGSLTVDPNNTNTTYSDFVGMVHNNKFMLFSKLGHVLYEGTVTSITLKDYTATVDVYKDGTKVDSSVSVTGTITNESIFTGTLAGGNNASSMGSFSLTYDTIYTNIPTYSRIEGANFVGVAKSTDDFDTSFGFRESTKSFIGATNTPSCLYLNGTVTLPSAQSNIYEITNSDILQETGEVTCSIITSGYNGMASLMGKSANTTDDRVYIALTNGTNSVFAIAER